jgi:transposase
LAELARRDLVPAIWLPDPEVRAERERARFRLHLVRQRSRLKHRIHATLLAHGVQCPVSDLFGVRGRALLAEGGLPEPWRSHVDTAVALIDELNRRIAELERALRQLGATHRYVPLFMTVPGIAWVLGYTIAAEIGDIGRFPTADNLTGYTGLCPRVYQSGPRDRRGPLSKQGPGSTSIVSTSCGNHTDGGEFISRRQHPAHGRPRSSRRGSAPPLQRGRYETPRHGAGLCLRRRRIDLAVS